MKEIELLSEATGGCKFDDLLGYYKVTKEGMDDIVVLKNMKYKTIKTKEVGIMGENNKEYIIETTINSQKYIVKPLDTLSSIANKFNKSINDIRKINNLRTDKLFIGQIINL